jgi:hypothetical protein
MMDGDGKVNFDFCIGYGRGVNSTRLAIDAMATHLSGVELYSRITVDIFWKGPWK